MPFVVAFAIDDVGTDAFAIDDVGTDSVAFASGSLGVFCALAAGFQEGMAEQDIDRQDMRRLLDGVFEQMTGGANSDGMSLAVLSSRSLDVRSRWANIQPDTGLAKRLR